MSQQLYYSPGSHRIACQKHYDIFMQMQNPPKFRVLTKWGKCWWCLNEAKTANGDKALHIAPPP